MQATPKIIDQLIKKIPQREHLFILGNFNTRVGSDSHLWSPHIGIFGVGKLNNNGRRLLELMICAVQPLYYQHLLQCPVWEESHLASSSIQTLAPDWSYTHKKAIPFLNRRVTRSFHSADCDTDHTLVCTIVKVKPQHIYSAKQKPRINTSNIQDKVRQAEFDSTDLSRKDV